MLYSKIQPLAVLEKFYHPHGGHLVRWCQTIQSNCQYPLDGRPHVKSGESGENCSVSEKKTFKNYTILMYISQGQGQKPQGTKF